MTATLQDGRPKLATLTPRWYPLRPIFPQIRLFDTQARFNVGSAGRRSGKTEMAKRFTYVGNDRFRGALNYDLKFDDGWFVQTAPTHAQAKRIFWNDMCALCPKWALRRKKESELTLKLFNGVEITVLGMDKPERVEGRSIDGLVADEYANMKPEAWDEHLRPSLSTAGRPGWAWLIGVPEGRNHYWQKFKHARDSGDPAWAAHTWKSIRVVDPAEIAQARKDMDELTFKQEFEGEFVDFTGRAYYGFDSGRNCCAGLRYDPDLDLIFCFDFNNSPGVACVLQEQHRAAYAERGSSLNRRSMDEFVAAIGEVWIDRHSNTKLVCARLAKDWGHHRGRVVCYGDATGGAKGTQAVEGSDWDIIERELRLTFGDRLRVMVGKSNPRERVRVNAVNSLCMNADGDVRFLAHPDRCKRLVEDLEGVVTVEGGSGEIDKEEDETLTHISDAFGYFVAEEHPVDAAPRATSSEI